MDERELSYQQLRDIKDMMARSSRFVSLSGLSGVSAGLTALAGAGAYHSYLQSQKSTTYHAMAEIIPYRLDQGDLVFAFVDAVLVLCISLGLGIFFTTRKAKKDGVKTWDRNVVYILQNLAIPLVTGAAFCSVLLYYNLFGLVAPTTLIFYGLALLNASKFTLDEIRWLGISEIALGLIGCFFIGYGLLFWAIGFGVLHIGYGLFMVYRYEMKTNRAIG